MKTYLLGAVAAVAVTLGLFSQSASAHWETRTTYKWDPYCCKYVCFSERFWVPDCEPCYRDRCDPCYRDRCDDGFGRGRRDDGFGRGRGDEGFGRGRGDESFFRRSSGPGFRR